jgi:hypothetical protein
MVRVKSVLAVERPFLLTFRSSGHTYAITREEAQRLLDEYPAVYASKFRVVLQGHNSSRATDRSVLRPATVGGGAAFVIEWVKE